MPSNWVNVSPGKKMVWKVNRVSFSFPFPFSLSLAEIVITETQIAATSVSVNTIFFLFIFRLDSMLGYFWPGPRSSVKDPFVLRFQRADCYPDPRSLQEGYKGWRER